MKYIGIDGCKAGWFVLGFDADGRSTAHVCSQISELAQYLCSTEMVLVDIPIGLKGKDSIGRLCDIQARTVLKPKRHASVFSAPSRCALGCSSYAEANAHQRSCSGKGLSKQTFNIIPKIREMDTFMRHNHYRDKIHEMHPEVCFWALNNQQAMNHNKKSEQGYQERINVLANYCSDAGAIVASALRAYPRLQVARDDIVDALVGAITATQVESLQRIPEKPEIDENGLPMEIVYWLPSITPSLIFA